MTMTTSPIAAACCVLLISLSACNSKPDAANPAASSAAPPAAGASAPAGAASAPAGPPVSISTVRTVKRDLPVLLKASGTVSSLSSVEVRAQVSSPVRSVHIREGQFVKKGDLLFTLDARSDEANLAKARAQLAKDHAALADAQRQLTRSKQLFSQSFISQGAVDTTQALVDSANATIASDQAAIDAVNVALSYASIRAPQSGRVGGIPVFAGTAIQANVTPMVTITQLDPIAVTFTLPQRNLSDALLALKNKGTVSASLADGGGSFQGHISFVDSSLDAVSGTLKAKAEFANPEGKLWPGAFVDVVQTVRTIAGAVVIPQAAIINAARGDIVYVIEDNKAAVRPIKVLTAEGLDAAVTGLKVGEVIALDGKQNLRPGAAVADRGKEGKEKSAGKPDAGKDSPKESAKP